MLIDCTEQELSFLGELFLNKGTKIVPQCIVGSWNFFIGAILKTIFVSCSCKKLRKMRTPPKKQPKKRYKNKYQSAWEGTPEFYPGKFSNVDRYVSPIPLPLLTYLIHLVISPIQLMISPIQLMISTIQLTISTIHFSYQKLSMDLFHRDRAAARGYF